MPRLLTIAFLLLCRYGIAQVKNTSYTNTSGEKVLRHEILLDASLQTAWDWCTKDELLSKWAAPKVHMELRTGGYRVANYDATKPLTDSSSIVLPLISFLDKELMVFKINLNKNFPEAARTTDGNLYFIFQFKKISEKKTAITGSMLGWGEGPDWEKTYQFFVEGNKWTFEQLVKNFKE